MNATTTRFSRSELIKGYDKQKNANTTVVVVGVGALGTWVSLALAGFGLKKIVLIDPDTVEESNLNRQMAFTNDDIGENKAFAMKKRIEERVPNNSTIVEASSEWVTEDNVDFEIPDDADIVFLCLDNAKTRLIINDYLVEKGTPFINGGTSEGHAGEYCFVIPGETPCLRCFFPEITESGNCSENPDPSIVGNSMSIAAGMVFQFQQWITGKRTIGPVYKFDGDRSEVEDKSFDENTAIVLGKKNTNKNESEKSKIPAPYYYLKRGFKKDCICQKKK